MSKEKTPINRELGFNGFSVYLPTLLKLRFYQEYLSKNSFWLTEKGNYWKLEQAVLYWAWSSKHQHLGNYINLFTVLRIFGYNQHQIYDGQHQLKGLTEHSIYIELFKEEGGDNLIGLSLQLMGNLVHKGFATPSEMDNKGSDRVVKALNTKDALPSKPFYIIVLNKDACLIGQLIHEVRDSFSGMLKYKILNFIFSLFPIIISILILITTLEVLNGSESTNYLSLIIESVGNLDDFVKGVVLSVLVPFFSFLFYRS